MLISKVVVMGLGYIGLPTAALLASRKIQVVGVDINPLVVETINHGKAHIVEPDLDILVKAVTKEGFLQAQKTPCEAEVYLIAVPTPFKEGHAPDISYIEKACLAIAPLLKKGNLIILESTSPVGTTAFLSQWLAKARPDLTFPHTHCDKAEVHLAYCPERVLPGHVLRELVANDRIIGGITPTCSELALAFYKRFVEGECIITDAATAEMCKLTENSFRDVNIAFANELSMICEELQINVWELIRLANRHPRVNILQPGPGVGGHCIAIDPWFIVHQHPEKARLIRTAREVNDSKPLWVLEQVQQQIGLFLQKHPQKSAKEIVIACFGLAFKADIDDLRESPALKITKELALIHPGPVLVVEPYTRSLPQDLAPLVMQNTMEQALLEADILLILVDHKPFKPLSHLVQKKQIIIDTRGLF